MHEVYRRNGSVSFYLNPFRAIVIVWDINNPPKHINVTEEDIEELSHAQAFAVELENDGQQAFGLALPKTLNEYTLWHEAIHTIDYIFEARGIPITEDNGEARTYATEYLVKLIKCYFYNKKVKDHE